MVDNEGLCAMEILFSALLKLQDLLVSPRYPNHSLLDNTYGCL